MAQIWRKQLKTANNIFGQVNGSGIVTSPSIVSIVTFSTSLVFQYSGTVTHYRYFLIGNPPGAWLNVTGSPVTVTGLTPNTEYVLQVSGDGATIDDTRDFGTLNPGTGTGSVSFAPVIVALAPINVSLTTFRPRYQLTY